MFKTGPHCRAALRVLYLNAPSPEIYSKLQQQQQQSAAAMQQHHLKCASNGMTMLRRLPSLPQLRPRPITGEAYFEQPRASTAATSWLSTHVHHTRANFLLFHQPSCEGECLHLCRPRNAPCRCQLVLASIVCSNHAMKRSVAMWPMPWKRKPRGWSDWWPLKARW